MNPKNTKKSAIHENADANITCNFGDRDISRLGVAYLPHAIHRYIITSIIVRHSLYIHSFYIQTHEYKSPLMRIASLPVFDVQAYSARILSRKLVFSLSMRVCCSSYKRFFSCATQNARIVESDKISFLCDNART